jgi:hypothetical protein
MPHPFLAPALRATLTLSWLLAAISLSLAAHAQPATLAVPAKRQDPLDARAAVPPLSYESSLKAIAPQADDKPLSWREANDRVARIGGWRVYAREAQQTTPPAQAPAR